MNSKRSRALSTQYSPSVPRKCTTRTPSAPTYAANPANYKLPHTSYWGGCETQRTLPSLLRKKCGSAVNARCSAKCMALILLPRPYPNSKAVCNHATTPQPHAYPGAPICQRSSKNSAQVSFIRVLWGHEGRSQAKRLVVSTSCWLHMVNASHSPSHCNAKSQAADDWSQASALAGAR